MGSNTPEVYVKNMFAKKNILWIPNILSKQIRNDQGLACANEQVQNKSARIQCSKNVKK